MSRDDSPTPPTSPPPSDGAPEAPTARKITDARTLRALAHPVRIALFEELAFGGAMTATEVGERIGESATTCSFHLRQLAKYGFVEEAGGGTGRSRPWRLTSIGMSFTPSGDPEAEIASDAVVRMFRERQFERYQAWRSTKASYPLEWRQAAIDSQYLFYLTAPELEQLSREVHEVLERWVMLEGRLTDPSRRPPGSVPVETTLLSHPLALPKPEGDDGDA
jgi:DNA-binding transcriptional ArsR family regulator